MENCGSTVSPCPRNRKRPSTRRTTWRKQPCVAAGRCNPTNDTSRCRHRLRRSCRGTRGKLLLSWQYPVCSSCLATPSSDLPVSPTRTQFVRNVLRVCLYPRGKSGRSLDVNDIGCVAPPLQCGNKHRDINPGQQQKGTCYKQ